MAFHSTEKEKYIAQWNPRDLLGLLYLPVFFVLILVIQFKISKHNPSLAVQLFWVIGGLFHILASKALSVLYNLEWIASPFAGKKIITPNIVRIIGIILILISFFAGR